jgi:hypothetical protein
MQIFRIDRVDKMLKVEPRSMKIASIFFTAWCGPSASKVELFKYITHKCVLREHCHTPTKSTIISCFACCNLNNMSD